MVRSVVSLENVHIVCVRECLIICFFHFFVEVDAEISFNVKKQSDLNCHLNHIEGLRERESHTDRELKRMCNKVDRKRDMTQQGSREMKNKTNGNNGTMCNVCNVRFY